MGDLSKQRALAKAILSQLADVGLVVGALVGAAFFGAVMNMSFMLAGSASTNPVLFSLAILMILAWKVAGYIGVDRFLPPIVGAPWSPGKCSSDTCLASVGASKRRVLRCWSRQSRQIRHQYFVAHPAQLVPDHDLQNASSSPVAATA